MATFLLFRLTGKKAAIKYLPQLQALCEENDAKPSTSISTSAAGSGVCSVLYLEH
ncbi:MAG: hypothetical protein GKR94_26570 [Gammaproteobacteria bacterium]|nr:hypothetical protein [Gammaproteobacteria bacterium]